MLNRHVEGQLESRSIVDRHDSVIRNKKAEGLVAQLSAQ